MPDSCADIARIVDTTGLVCLTNRELTGDGRFSASGTVEVSVRTEGDISPLTTSLFPISLQSVPRTSTRVDRTGVPD